MNCAMRSSRLAVSGELAIAATSMLPLFCVSMPLKRAVAAARYSFSEILPSPLVSIFCSMCWKKDGRESGAVVVGAVLCASAQTDSAAMGKAVSTASLMLRDIQPPKYRGGGPQGG